MEHRGMLGKRVIDTDAIELGVVSKEEEKCIEVSEGLFDELLLDRSYIGREEEEEVILRDNLHNLLVGLEVLDSKEQKLGKVYEEVTAGDVLDNLIIENEDKEIFFITLEEIYKIDEAITLDIDTEDVKFRQETHTLRDHIKHYIEKRKSRK